MRRAIPFSNSYYFLLEVILHMHHPTVLRRNCAINSGPDRCAHYSRYFSSCFYLVHKSECINALRSAFRVLNNSPVHRIPFYNINGPNQDLNLAKELLFHSPWIMVFAGPATPHMFAIPPARWTFVLHFRSRRVTYVPGV